MTPQRLALAAALTLAVAAPAAATPVVGKPAPAFTAVDGDGRARSLSEFKGRTVVLEWTNAGCPYVQKHYNSGAMQGLQKGAVADGAVWLTLISSAPGKQGYVAPAAAKTWKSDTGAGSTALLLDPAGKVGKAYEAKTTPHMYIVDKAGTLVYMGGIDDKPTADPREPQGREELCRRRALRRAGGAAGRSGGDQTLRLLRQVRGVGAQTGGFGGAAITSTLSLSR